MTMTIPSRRTWRNLSASALLAGLAALASTAASANGCPANQMGQNALSNAPTKPAGVTDTVLEQIDLSKQMVKLEDHLLPSAGWRSSRAGSCRCTIMPTVRR